MLEKAHKDFLDKAGERFTAADKASETKLKELLAPVETTLKRYEEGLQQVEKERVDHYAGLREAVELVRAGQGQVRDETRNLVNALRSSPKARGRWGEQSLANVLEQAGLSPYADFHTEVSVDTDDGRLRPDVIVRLPGGPQADHRRQMLAQRLPRRLRRGRRRQARGLLPGPSSPRSATTPSNSARRPIGRSSATPPIMS